MALIYNFIFAKILVGTKITRQDVLGTFVVIASVIWIVVFGGMYNGEDRMYSREEKEGKRRPTGGRLSSDSFSTLLLSCYDPVAENTISLENLKMLFTRPVFIIYFSALNLITFSGLLFAIWSRWVLNDDKRKHQSHLFIGMKPKRMRRVVGLMFSLEGGMLASETLLLAKSGYVKI